MIIPNNTDHFKLPIGKTLREIYQFLWSAIHSFFLLATIPVLTLTAYWGIAIELIGLNCPGDSQNPAAAWELCVLYLPALTLFSAFAVTWHRRYLNPNIQVGIKDSLIPLSRHLKYFLSTVFIWLIAFAAVTVPVVIVIIFTLVINFAAGGETRPPVDVETVTIFIGIVAFLLFSFIFLRLSLWLSIVAIASPFSLLEAWRLGQNNFLQLFAIGGGTAIIPLILIALYQLAPTEPQLLLPQSGNLSIKLAMWLGQFSVTYITLAFGITMISVSYDRLLGRITNDPFYTLETGPFINE